MTRSRSLRPLAGWTSLLGGIVWLAHTVLLAMRPTGCVGAACFEGGRHHRESEDIAWVLLVAVLLLTAAIASDRTRERSAWRTAALALYGCGAALLVLGLVINQGRSEGAELWWLHDSDTLGRALPVLGTLAFGVSLFTVGRHRWLAALFIVATVVGLGFNAQDERTLLSLPIGIAWMLFGAMTLLSTATLDARETTKPRA